MAARQARPGTAYFAHLLPPHYSYLLDSDCNPRPDVRTWYAFAGLAAVPPARHSSLSRSQIYIAHFDQVRCSQRKIGQMLDALRESAALDDSIIILHGDHGSRIARHLVLDSQVDLASDGDFIDSYSTLFAIRSPAIQAGYDRSLRSIQALFAEFALDRPFREERAEVYATPARRGAQVPLQTRPMVDFGW